MMKGRVLTLTSTFPRWHDDSTTPFVPRLAVNLQKIGWQVDILAPHAHGAAKTEIIDGLRVKRFQYLWPSSRQTVCYQGGAMINLRRNKLNYLKLPALLFSEWLSLCRSLAAGHYDILHSHWILPQGFVGALAAGVRIPHVITVHGGDVFGLRGELYARARKFALRRAAGITVNSSVTEQAVRDIVPAAAVIKRIPMGVRVTAPGKGGKQVDELRRYFKKDGGSLLIFVGRVIGEKGVADLLAALKMLLVDSVPVTLVVVGEGQDRPEMEALARELRIADAVHFVGWQSAARVSDYLAAADIFIGPSRTAANGWREAQGLTFLEAMMAGTPVIASRAGGIVDAVRHEQTGLLVDERAPRQICQAVKRLLDDQQLYQRLAVNGRKMAEEDFSEEASALAFDKLFSQLLSCRK
ncbi:glycosyltransferase family 4 protein [Desulfobacterota bacterium M19]